jgi:hypothetical protein
MTIKEIKKRIKDYTGDKRSLVYRSLKEELKIAESQQDGLGDKVEKITKATGIKKVVDTVAKALDVDCGCDERKEKLNSYSRNKVVDCPTQEEYIYLDDFFKTYKGKVSVEQQKELLTIYNRIFKRNKQMTSCNLCFKPVINNLETIYKNY